MSPQSLIIYYYEISKEIVFHGSKRGHFSGYRIGRGNVYDVFAYSKHPRKRLWRAASTGNAFPVSRLLHGERTEHALSADI